jgi:hypothetical protein
MYLQGGDVTSSGVPVGDTTLLAKLRQHAESNIHDVVPAGVIRDVVTLIEEAVRVVNGLPFRSLNGVDLNDLRAALAPFVGEATQHDENCWIACPHESPPEGTKP